MSKRIIISFTLILVVSLISWVVFIQKPTEKESFSIGNYEIVYSQNYKPIGKQGIEGMKKLATYKNLSELREDPAIDSSFLDSLKEYNLERAVHFNYIEQGKIIDSWDFILNGNIPNQIRITINPARNNPIHIRYAWNPERIKIGSSEILLYQGAATTFFLEDEHVNSIIKGKKGSKATVWMDGKNLTRKEALEIARVFIGSN